MLIFSLIIITLLLSALFSGSEIAYVSTSKLRIEVNRKRVDRRGRIIAHFYDDASGFLSTMLVGNNIVLVAFTYLMTLVLTPTWEVYVKNEVLLLFLNTITITIVVLVFGEYLPKTFFAYFADRLLYMLAYPLQFLKWILFAPTFLMNSLSNVLLYRVARVAKEDINTSFSRRELDNFVKRTVRTTTKEVNTELFGRALFLENVRVRDRMIPRQDIKYIDQHASIEDLKDTFSDTKLSRIIVCDKSLDEVKGYVHHLQLLDMPARIADMQLHAVTYLPEQMRLQGVLNKFIKQNLNLALIVDEYGTTTGLVTLENVLEEIFGEINDEHDQEDEIEEVLEDGRYQFSGRMEIDHLNKVYEMEIPEGDYNTLSGYIVTASSKMPEAEETLELGRYRYHIQVVNQTHINTVLVEKIPHEDQEAIT